MSSRRRRAGTWSDDELRALLVATVLPPTDGPAHFDADHVVYFAGLLMGHVMKLGGRVTVVRSIRIVAEDFERRERAQQRGEGSPP